MGWETDALATLDRLSGTELADRYRERRADRAFRERRTDRAFRERDPARPRPAETPASDAPDHVVVVVADALRADALGGPTPFLDSLAGTTAITPSTWTFPAVTSLLTGQYPASHGATRQSDDFDEVVADVTGLPPESGATGVAERFAAAGYDTYGGFGMVVPFLALSGRFRTHRLYDDAGAERVLGDHLDWLADRRERRTFSYLHLADLHEPVDPPREYWQAHGVDASIPGIRSWRHEDVVTDTPAVERFRDHRKRLYRAGVEYVDNRLGAYARRLSELVADDCESALAVVGDHGEGFWERADHAAAHFADSRPAYCVGHGGAPYEVLTRVPFRVAGLDLGEGVGTHGGTDAPVSLVDLAPTLADAAGLHFDADGVPLARGVPDDRVVRVESARYGFEKRAAYRDGRKLVVSRGDDYAEGFSVSDRRRADEGRADEGRANEEPVELPPDLEADLRAALPAWPGAGDAGSQPRDDAPDRAVEKRLADLGYR